MVVEMPPNPTQIASKLTSKTTELVFELKHPPHTSTSGGNLSRLAL